MEADRSIELTRVCICIRTLVFLIGPVTGVLELTSSLGVRDHVGPTVIYSNICRIDARAN